MAKTPTRSENELTRRFLLLADWLGDTRHGRPAHGWKAKVAENLGISPTYLAKLHSGERAVGLRLATEAALRVHFDLSYFTDVDFIPPADFAAYQETRGYSGHPLTMTFAAVAGLARQGLNPAHLSPDFARALAGAILKLTYVQWALETIAAGGLESGWEHRKGAAGEAAFNIVRDADQVRDESSGLWTGDNKEQIKQYREAFQQGGKAAVAQKARVDSERRKERIGKKRPS